MVSPPPKCPTYVFRLQRCGSHEDPGPASQRRRTRVARWKALRERRRQAVSRGHRYPRWQVRSKRISVRCNPYQPVLAAFSVVTLDTCVRNFSRFTGCSLGEAIKCVTYNPARCLGIENRKGTLRPGADADLVVLDRSGNVLGTWVRGREVWKKE